MPDSPPLRYFPYIASGLGCILGGEGKEGIKFFNPVNFVKFVRLMAHNMNGADAYFATTCFLQFRRSVS